MRILECLQRVNQCEKRFAGLTPTPDAAAGEFWRVKLLLAKADMS